MESDLEKFSFASQKVPPPAKTVGGKKKKKWEWERQEHDITEIFCGLSLVTGFLIYCSALRHQESDFCKSLEESRGSSPVKDISVRESC